LVHALIPPSLLQPGKCRARSGRGAGQMAGGVRPRTKWTTRSTIPIRKRTQAICDACASLLILCLR